MLSKNRQHSLNEIWIPEPSAFEKQLQASSFKLPAQEPTARPVLPGDHRVLEPPDPIPNSEVKRQIADGSVGFPHVRVGHRQAPYFENAENMAVF